MNIAVLFRWLIGLLFIVSGGEKLIGPYQNFLFVVQNYQFLPPLFEELVARLFPWIELILGIFLLLGLWTRQALFGILLMFGGFMTIVGQAIVRDLPITECGCFGELISFPLPVILTFDSTMFLISLWLSKRLDLTRKISLDQYFG